MSNEIIIDERHDSFNEGFFEIMMKPDQFERRPMRVEKKAFAKLGEIKDWMKNKPTIPYLLPGVKEGSFGFVFGPSKSGKTIFLEGLLLHIACGRKNYLGFPLNARYNRCLFISLEERAKDSRYHRNLSQLYTFTDDERALIESNYCVSHEKMPSHVYTPEDWVALERAIIDSSAKYVVIDSLNHLSSESIADEEKAKAITQKFAELVDKLGTTLFVINHTTKSSNEGVQTIASMSGSRIYGSEAEFLIAVNRLSNNNRYIKLVASRHGKDDYEEVHKFYINGNHLIELDGRFKESALFEERDGRVNEDNLNIVAAEINNIRLSKHDFVTSDLMHLVPSSMSKPTLHGSLDKLRLRGTIERIKNGYYRILK